jgi:hypothetical protein
MHVPLIVRSIPVRMFTARDPGVRARAEPLWAPRVHDPFTTRPLHYAIVRQGKSRYFHEEWFFCVEGPCGDSARCKASAGINGVVCGADILFIHGHVGHVCKSDVARCGI